ncbi:uncharacterized protein PAF06_007354 [Gastrophryne carolinensis]
MAGSSYCAIQDESSSDSDVCWLGSANLEQLSEIKSEDIWEICSPRSYSSRKINSDEEETCITLYENVHSFTTHNQSLQSRHNYRSLGSKSGRRTYKPRSTDRTSPEKSIARERSTIDSAGNITLMTETVYKCNKCDKTFFTRSGYRKHQRNHAEDDRNVCGECGEAFADQTSLDLHKEVHLREKPWLCTVCHKQFRLQSHLAKHKRIHTGQRPYTCKVCGNSFSQSSNLSAHMKTHFGTNSKNSRIYGYPFAHDNPQIGEHRTIITEGTAFTGSECGRGFERKAHLASHQRAHSSNKPSPVSHRNKSFSSNLIPHTMDHFYACMICGKEFNNGPSCAIHEKTHSETKSFPCGGCGLDFSTCDSYTTHSCILIS